MTPERLIQMVTESHESLKEAKALIRWNDETWQFREV